MIIKANSLQSEIYELGYDLSNHGYEVKTDKWQGESTDKTMIELVFGHMAAYIPESINDLTWVVQPNLPWADIHFKERVGGQPLNPGESYKHWPAYVRKATDDRFRVEQGQFSHTYMERIWPKKAGELLHPEKYDQEIQGIRYAYGDLDDVVELLKRDPFTRQAYLPIWFPEDTGAVHGGRVPCTLGYLFIRRDDRLHVSYHIRSCDYLRHFRDDVYLACRKVYWILEQLSGADRWEGVKPGLITMSIDSLHVFQEDLPTLNYSLKSYAKKFNL